MICCKLLTVTAFIYIQSSIIFTSATSINILPVDVAKEMMECALDAGWATANERFGSQGEADARKTQWKDHAYKMKKLSIGILKDSTCSDIQNMFLYQAWRTANERKGYSNDRDNDIKAIKRYYNNILNSGDLTSTLAANIKSMGGNIAWYCANTIVGYDDDAVRDKANYESAYSRIHGEITLVEMKFFTNQADVKSRKPKVISEQLLVNNVDETQTMEFKFDVTEGHTTTISHEFGFTFGVTVGLTAGFANVETSFEVSFEISYKLTLSESLSQGTTKSYTFPLTVPGKSTYKAKGTVTEAEMDVPYEMIFDFDGVRKSFFGTWTGVAVSQATYTINEVPPSTPATPSKPTQAAPSWSWWGR